MRAPAAWAMRSASRLTATGRATWAFSGVDVRHDERRRAVGVVDDHLVARSPDGVGVHGLHQGRRVVLDGVGREADVADVGGEGPPEVLAVVVALDLALGGLVDVGAVGV